MSADQPGAGASHSGQPFPVLRPHLARLILAAVQETPSNGSAVSQGEQAPLEPTARLLGEDVMGLVLHQHLHALDVGAPELQAVLHPLDLRAQRGHSVRTAPWQRQRAGHLSWGGVQDMALSQLVLIGMKANRQEQRKSTG